MALLVASLTLMGMLVANQAPQAITQMGRVSGQVIEAGTNTPVADARVFVILDGELSTAGPPLEVVTDRDGGYRFDAVPAGLYRIAALKADFAPPMEPSTMQLFEMAAGQTVDGLTVILRRGGVIAGRVLDARAQPLAGVGVTALLKRLNSNDRPAGLTSSGAPLLMPFGQSQTNGLGEFRILGLAPGEYLIVASARSRFGEPTTSSSATTVVSPTFFPATADVSAAQPVAVQEDETVSNLTIQLVIVPAFEMSGVVVDEAGAPVAGAMVMLMSGRTGTDSLFFLSMGPPGMSQSDASGRFSFGEVPAGSYTLRASGDGGGFFGISDDFIIDGGGTPRAVPNRPRRAPEPGTIEVTIDDSNVSDLTIVVPRSQ